MSVILQASHSLAFSLAHTRFCKVLGGIQTPPKPRFDVSTPESLSLCGVIQKLQALPLSETAPVSIVIGTFIVCRPAVFKEPGSVNHKETGRN